MEQDIIILYAKRFDRLNDNGVSEVGVDLWYYPAADLSPRETGDKKNQTLGMMPCKAVLDEQLYDELINVPGHYKAVFDFVPAGDQGLSLKLSGLDHVSTCTILEAENDQMNWLL